ncbi:MAG: site-specific integrase [Cyclobacteriaceae bacterium]|nr:site-specific integrase [Cyclobacteriaceae bacterium]
MAKRKQGETLPTYILWPWSANEAGKHPVKIRVNHQRKRKYYPVMNSKTEKLFLTEREYNTLTKTDLSKLRGENRVIRLSMERAVTDAIQAIEEATHNGKRPFSFAEFERKYLGSDTSRNFLAYFRQHIDVMAKRGQAGTVRTYESAFSALHNFQHGKDFDPSDLTVKKLEAFEEWLKTARPKTIAGRKRGHTKPLNNNSIGIYMRCLRSVFNELAMHDEYLKAVYPFSVNGGRDKKYLIPVGGGQKGVTLDNETLRKFIAGKIEGEEIPENPMYRAKLIFLFSFFAQGINPIDIALLRYENIASKSIAFERRKTIRTRTEARTIEIPLIEELREIISALGNPNKGKKEFVFEVFTNGVTVTPKEQDDRIRQFVKTTNKWLKRFCRLNELPEFSMYSARHTFASLSKVHLPVAQISKMLGHSRITTTQTYLGRFDHEQNEKALRKVFATLKTK